MNKSERMNHPRNHTKQHEQRTLLFRVASCDFVDRHALFFFYQTPVLLALLFLCIVMPQARAQDDALPELVRRIKPSVVAIVTYDAKGARLSRGSGFFTASDRVVTNRHVLEGAY